MPFVSVLRLRMNFYGRNDGYFKFSMISLSLTVSFPPEKVRLGLSACGRGLLERDILDRFGHWIMPSWGRGGDLLGVGFIILGDGGGVGLGLGNLGLRAFN